MFLRCVELLNERFVHTLIALENSLEIWNTVRYHSHTVGFISQLEIVWDSSTHLGCHLCKYSEHALRLTKCCAFPLVNAICLNKTCRRKTKSDTVWNFCALPMWFHANFCFFSITWNLQLLIIWTCQKLLWSQSRMTLFVLRFQWAIKSFFFVSFCVKM